MLLPMPHRNGLTRLAFATLGLSILSCAEAETQGELRTGSGGAAIGSGGTSSGNTATGTGGSVTSDGGPIGPLNDASLIGIDGPPPGSVDGGLLDAACAQGFYEAKRLPLDMYIMLDSSDSMTGLLADNRTTKWDAVRKALTSFVTDMGSNGLGVGLQYFPIVQTSVPNACLLDQVCGQFGPCNLPMTCLGGTTVVPCKTNAECGGQQCVRLGVCRRSGGLCAPAGSFCGPGDTCEAALASGYCDKRDSCDANAYATPAVDIGVLPGAAQGIVNSLAIKMPDGLTPTSSALRGALARAKGYATSNPNHRVVVVLATDGYPTECSPTDIPGVAKIASDALGAMPSIATFVIGVYTPTEAAILQSNLNALAIAGGTKQAFIVSTGQDVTAGFLAALNTIRTNALSCEYSIPRPEAGQLDYGLINVLFSAAAGQTSTIGYAGTACSGKGGWTYDVSPTSGTPSKIVICDASCDSFKAAGPQAQVSIQLGCKTIVI